MTPSPEFVRHFQGHPVRMRVVRNKLVMNMHDVAAALGCSLVEAYLNVPSEYDLEAFWARSDRETQDGRRS
jgi:hypothetical protein